MKKEEYTDRWENLPSDTPRQESFDWMSEKDKTQKTNSRIVLIIIALVFLSPLLKGLFSGVLGVVVTILLLPFLVVFTLGVSAIGLIIGGAACLVAGIPLCFTLTPTGFLTIGVGCILESAGLACFAALLYLAARWLPGILASVSFWINRAFHRKENKSR